MYIEDIPFAKHTGIARKEEGTLKLKKSKLIENHVQSIHGAAQFTLAETQSGLYLRSLFPEYMGKVLPLLRSSSVKYKHPATTDIYAIAKVSDEAKEKFEAQFNKKGRAIISVNVELRDDEDIITMLGEFVWFIQKV